MVLLSYIEKFYLMDHTRNVLEEKNLDKTLYIITAANKIYSKHLSKCYLLYFSVYFHQSHKKMNTILTFSCLLRDYLFKDSSRCISMVHMKGNASC